MRFALATGQANISWESLRGLWDAADPVSMWASAWTGDHFYPFLSDPGGPCMEGWVTLTALAARTRRLRVGLLTEEVTTFCGRYYRLAQARCEPKPVQRPRPPITIGGAGERRTAAVAARWADHWNLGFTRPGDVPRKLAALAERCAEIGRDASGIDISVVVRTESAGRRRDLREVADEIADYAQAGCQIAIVEARAASPAEAPAEIERLTGACRPLAAG